MKSRLRLWSRAAGVALLAACAVALQAQSVASQAAADEKRAARGEVLLDQNSGGPDLISGPNGEAILRYPVAHWHAMSACLGWLYISHDTMRYEVVSPEQDKGHAFELRRSDLAAAQQWRVWGTSTGAAEFKFRTGGTYHFSHVRKGILQSGNYKLVMSNSFSYQDLVDGTQNFDDIVAMLKAKEVPPAPTAPPPTISMLEPTGAEEGRTVPAYDSTLHVRGIASHASGIASVSVNGQSAFFKPLAPQTVEFDLRDLPLSAGMSAVVVVATATDKSVSQMTFKVTRPEVRVLEPGRGAEVAESAVRVRGLAVGFRDVDRVEVAGQLATLRRREDGSVEFEAASVPLIIGSNNLQGSVVASTGQRQNFSLDLTRKPPPGPPALTLEEVETALRNELPKARVASLANQYGVDFELTDDVEKRLRAVGADSNLLLDLVKAYKGPAKPKTVASASPPPAQSAPPRAPSPAASQPVAQSAPPPTSSPAPAVSQPAAQTGPPPAPQPMPPPALQILDPAGVEEGKSVETAGAVLRGTAIHGSGISAVLVNDRLASLKAITAQSVQFEAADLSLMEAWTPVTVVVRSTDNSQSRLSFKLSRPAVHWMNPPGGAVETAATALLAQGTAVGFNGVEKVELAGTSLTLEKLADGKVEFHTILPLALGQNTFKGVAVGSSGFRVAFKLEVNRVAAGSTSTTASAARPSPAPAASSSPSRAGAPTLQIVEPAGVEDGAQVETVSSTVRGTAVQGSGISAVLVNDKPASLKTLSPQSVEFEFIDLSLSSSWTKVIVVARATDNAQTKMSFKLSRPQVRWLDPPSGVLETSSAAILARGQVLGFRGVRKVELAGTELTTENSSDGVRFQTVLPLALGPNTFEGVVTSTSGFRLPFKLEVNRSAKAAAPGQK
jgi:hypothetical protein